MGSFSSFLLYFRRQKKSAFDAIAGQQPDEPPAGIEKKLTSKTTLFKRMLNDIEYYGDGLGGDVISADYPSG